MEEDGFFSTLFDFGFKKFLTSKIVPVLFGLSVAGWALASLAIPLMMVKSFHKGGFFFLGLLLAVPVFLVGVILSRLWAELVIVLFKIAENTRETAIRISQAPRPPVASSQAGEPQRFASGPQDEPQPPAPEVAPVSGREEAAPPRAAAQVVEPAVIRYCVDCVFLGTRDRQAFCDNRKYFVETPETHTCPNFMDR